MKSLTTLFPLPPTEIGCGTPPAIPTDPDPDQTMDYAAGTVVSFDDTVTYTCNAGGAMADDLAADSFDVTCQSSGEYTAPPSPWPLCARSK